jgi:5-methylcytosine-specific restriction endonuclease McrA
MLAFLIASTLCTRALAPELDVSKSTANFTIKEKELAEALEISSQRLDEIIDFFNSDPSDEWDLVENDHFMYVNESLKIRIFSAHGAFAIAKYLDTHEEKSLWARIVEFVTHHREKVRNAFVHKKVYENSSSLTRRNDRYFLSKKDIVAILCTSYARLNKAYTELQKSDQPLEKFADFDDIEGVRYYSLSGTYRLSQHLSKKLTREDRRAWCSAVEVAGKRALNAIVAETDSRQRRIDKVKKAAKKRDNATCQITQQKRDKHDDGNLAGHHIFSSVHYPHLAISEDNIITLKERVHQEFHVWNGGTNRPCTVEDLIQFVCERYPDKPEALTRLYQVKSMFSNEKVIVNPRRPASKQLPEDRAA